mmetsp:Transcript_29024/g.59176  ORF Transcript_29024/g.59176 Transcript_29024/m.59176 type:complete len:201 (-) Transcript_29024:1414-2016(-)
MAMTCCFLFLPHVLFADCCVLFSCSVVPARPEGGSLSLDRWRRQRQHPLKVQMRFFGEGDVRWHVEVFLAMSVPRLEEGLDGGGRRGIGIGRGGRREGGVVGRGQDGGGDGKAARATIRWSDRRRFLVLRDVGIGSDDGVEGPIGDSGSRHKGPRRCRQRRIPRSQSGHGNNGAAVVFVDQFGDFFSKLFGGGGLKEGVC